MFHIVGVQKFNLLDQYETKRVDLSSIFCHFVPKFVSELGQKIVKMKTFKVFSLVFYT